MDQVSKLKIETEKLVNYYLDLASKKYQVRFSLDNLLFNLKGQSAGQFIVKRSYGRFITTIRINSYLLQKYGYEFINEVVPHECAHLVVYGKWGGALTNKTVRVKPHGKEWKEVMHLFGREPTVRHQFDTLEQKKKRYIYRCSCDGKLHELSLIRHNKISNKGVRYQCRNCLDILVLHDQNVNEHKKSA